MEFPAQLFLIAAHDPNSAPSKISAANFRGGIARFEFNDVSATIDNDRWIFCLIDYAAQLPDSGENTLTPLAQPVGTRDVCNFRQSSLHALAPRQASCRLPALVDYGPWATREFRIRLAKSRR